AWRRHRLAHEKGADASRWSMSESSESPVPALRASGFTLLEPEALSRLVGVPLETLTRWTPLWDDLPRDAYLKDGGTYRARRHSCFVQDLARDELEQVAHRAHWQSEDYNALHGGMERWFEPLLPELSAAPAWRALLGKLGHVFAQVRPEAPVAKW